MYFVPPKMEAARRWMVRPVGKTPVSIATGQASGWTDPAHWASYCDASAHWLDNASTIEGLSFVVAPESDTANLIWMVLDFDNAFDAEGILYPWIAKLLADLPPTFVEFSRSGRGLHAYFLVLSAPLVGMGKKEHPEGSSIEANLNGQVAFTGNVFGETRDVSIIDPSHLALVPYFEVRHKGAEEVEDEATPEVEACDPSDLARCRESIADVYSVNLDGGDISVFNVACEIARFGIPFREGMQLLVEWNDTNAIESDGSPCPWDRDRLKYKIQEAYKRVKADGEFGQFAIRNCGFGPIDPGTFTYLDIDPPDSDNAAEWDLVIADEGFFGAFGQYARRYDPTTPADINAVYGHLKQMAGNVIGRRAYIVIGPDRHYPKLNRVYVGKTSRGQKGTAYGVAIQPFKVSQPKWSEKRIKKGFNSGEAIVSFLRDEDESKDENAKDDDATIETLAPGPPIEKEDKRCLWFASEYGMVLTCISREGSTASMISRDSWDDVTLARGVVKDEESFSASRTHITILGHCTREEMKEKLQANSLFDGYCNRHEYFYVQRRKLVIEDEWTLEQEKQIRADQSQAVNECADAITKAMLWLDGLHSEAEGESNPRHVKGVEFKLDEAARAVMLEFTRRYFAEIESSSMGHLFARAIPLVKRSALINAVMDCSRSIRPEHVAAAIAEWEYGRLSAEYIFAYTLTQQQRKDSLAKAVADAEKWVRSKGGKTTTRELARGPKACGRAGIAKRVLEALHNANKGKFDGNNFELFAE